MLRKTIEQAQPSSVFATTIVRVAGTVEIHCGFTQESDADRLASLVQARPAPARAGWFSHRSFRLDAAKELALAGRLQPRERKG